MHLPVIRVTCAVIVHRERIFAAQRGPHAHQPLKWEFPGGKVEPGESDEACLLRELSEELQMMVTIIKRLPVFRHQYPDFIIELIPFICRPDHTGHKLQEHEEAGWFPCRQLRKLHWADADVALMEYVADLFCKGESSLLNP